MKKDPHNIQAFPSGRSEEEGLENNLSYREGMTLRDYFAGQALVAMEGGKRPVVHYGIIADSCYMMADAMLYARSKVYDKPNAAPQQREEGAYAAGDCSQLCPVCHSRGFAPSTRLRGRCQFCDGTVGGVGPDTPEFEKDYPANSVLDRNDPPNTGN